LYVVDCVVSLEWRCVFVYSWYQRTKY